MGKKMGKQSARKREENSERAEMLKWEALAERDRGFLEVLRLWGSRLRPSL